MASNTFDPTKINKLAKEAEQKEVLKRVTDAVRLHEGKQKLQRITDGKNLADTLSSIDFDTDFDQLSKDARADAAERANAIVFMYDELSDFVQLAPGSLALICAATGTGKSTLTANVAYALLRAGKRTLIIANEEKRTDVAARISCLQLDVSIHDYKRKGGLPDLIRDNVLDNIANLNKRMLTIIALDYKNDQRVVTSPEGMEQILDQATGKYDAVIIDYYQNINHSIHNPGFQAHEANEMFAKHVDNIKNTIGCPIIMMAQIRRGDDDFKVRLEGRRLILNKCTDIFEIKIDKPNRRSALIAHKDRWLGNQGEERFLGYDRGKFVPYTREFEEKMKQSKVSVYDALASDVDMSDDKKV